MTYPDLPEELPVQPNSPRAVTGPARWVLSSLDYHAHVLTDGDPSLGVVTARCGALVPMVVTEHDQPLGRKCSSCDVILRTDLDALGRFVSTPRD